MSEERGSRRPNHLIHEKSPYLQEHAYNPVDWYPFGNEAIAKAKAESKPILLSIGYSSCHWCLVLARESFEDAKTAAMINENFVAIKVDREERPELDDFYMAAVQSMAGQGGWPLNVFLTPDLKPFFGGTYFPPEPREGMPSFMQVLEFVIKAWKEKRSDVVQTASQIMDALRLNYQKTSSGEVPASVLEAGYATLVSAFDPEHGGYGAAPKFPAALTMGFLLRFYHRTRKELALRSVVKTLEEMAAGGIRDHVGGGFHRYSTDRLWLVPHFEKMLYDNALLARLYLEAYQTTHDETMVPPAADALSWMLVEMRDGEGGFYASQSADSAEGEGSYYTWTPEEVTEVLGQQDAETFCYLYGVTRHGNFESHRSILHAAHSPDDAALRLAITHSELSTKIEKWKAELYRARLKRPRPPTDKKVLTSWNGLAVSAFAKAGRVLGDQRYLDAAGGAAAFVLNHLVKDGVLLRRYIDGESAMPGTLEDYAFFAQGLIDLFEADGDPKWLEEAVALQQRTLELFRDAEDGAYFLTTESVPARIKVGYDGSTPSGNSVAITNALRISELTGNAELKAKAQESLKAFHESMEEQPSSLANMLTALDLAVNGMKEVVVTGTDGGSVAAMVREFDGHFVPEAVLVTATPARWAALSLLTPLLEGRDPAKPATVYICENNACRRPVDTPEDLRRALG
ncbi:MAG TPA: thioredoxin domain-containing protein [Nitrososphaerales archaeon]|nr:thioredoxin domain-containing protein [Nitrososphaerales archaeon]